ncbi:MAG TPA: ABC-type transport auxiliary lipoprotein family protein [Burkholderiales bacterium]|nr:ABC-type transport auxiliary lipoprotein family protein [Burkholderiales bacterium]HUP09031.1 ABC-type transport auxiliary lipoprotein family protein [Caldimonas sp.]
MKRIAALVAAALLSGCPSLGNPPAYEYYVLDDLGSAGVSSHAPRIDRVLLVAEASVSPFYDTQALVFSRVPVQRAYYQFAAWTERPGSRFTQLLTRRLDARGAFRAVAATTAGAKGDLVLNVRLEEFYHDASLSPGSVRIEVSVELVDRAQRAIVAQRRFARSAPTAADDAPAAVAAFDRAVTGLLDEVSAWVEDAAARAS